LTGEAEATAKPSSRTACDSGAAGVGWGSSLLWVAGGPDCENGCCSGSSAAVAAAASPDDELARPAPGSHVMKRTRGDYRAVIRLGLSFRHLLPLPGETGDFGF